MLVLYRAISTKISFSIMPFPVYSVGAVEDKTQTNRQRFSGTVGWQAERIK